MKKKYEWYFSPSDDEIDKIWKEGILTVDANVLLDLYRYHETTKNALIHSIKGFQGRLWLSNQASEEYIRNRTKVIISSEKIFKQASDEIDKLKSNLESSVAQLKGNRIIPANLAESLLEKIIPIVEEAKKTILEAQSKHPQYIQEDLIIEELSQLFDNSVGPNFNSEEMPNIKTEAERRKKEQIPPGYLDKDKDDDRPYGDYYLWHQILLHSKSNEKSIILVTSERKEDWWERLSGKTIGPRPELLREAFEFCGKRILIYQTDRFLEISSQRAGNAIDDSVVEEIRAVDDLRLSIEHAVELIEHNIQTSTETINEGTISVNLKRPVKNLTASGMFDVIMKSVPNISTYLQDHPDNMPKIKIRSGTGTTFNFNLHVISDEHEILLPIGKYEFLYKATCENQDIEKQITDN